MSDPLVGVTQSKYITGADSLSQQDLAALTTVPLSEALESKWPSDAHLVLYQLVDGQEPMPGWPRCNKPVLPEIRAHGKDLVAPIVALDYDNPGHQPWTQPAKDAFERSILDASVGLPLAMGWTWFYFTRAGARLIYVLTRPVSVEELEGLMLGMVRDFQANGIAMDTAACDWTRLFRLPGVLRDNESTSASEFFELIEQPGFTLDPDSVVPGERSASSLQYAGLERMSNPLPDHGWARDALVDKDSNTGRRKANYFYKAAKKQLQGRECYPCIFESAPIAPKGERNSAIQRLTGEAVAMLSRSGIRGVSAEMVYALFYEALEQLNAEDPNDSEDFFATGWKAIQQYWSKEEAKTRAEQEAQQKQQQAFQEHQGNLTSHVLAGVREWAGDELPKNPEDQVWWLGEHLIAATATHFHIMLPSGYYDPLPVTRQLVCSRIREVRMEALMPLEKYEDGKQKQVSPQELIDRHATAVSGIEGAVSNKGCFVRDPGKGHATLQIRLYRRKNLEPRFDVEVDAWLHRFAGENYNEICDWIGHALNFEGGPICALSIDGSPGCGKKMFYQGLAEAIDTEVVAGSKEFGRFKGLLMRTPFLVVNEGINQTNGGMHPADEFRHLVSGDPIYAEKKYHEPVLIKNPVRVMFFANNTDIVQQLTGNRDLSPEDREALAMRIFHHSVKKTASDWLRMRGGLDWTRGWVGGDDGAPSQYRVARHFLHLYENRPPVRQGNRLLIEGNMTDALMREMSTRSGSAPLVIETLIKMIEVQSPLPGLHVNGRRIYVTTSSIVDFFRMSEMANETTLNSRIVSKVLKGIELSDSNNEPRRIEVSKGQFKTARWREIDPILLLQEAIENGYQCRSLESIANDQLIHQRELEKGLKQIEEGLR